MLDISLTKWTDTSNIMNLNIETLWSELAALFIQPDICVLYY